MIDWTKPIRTGRDKKTGHHAVLIDQLPEPHEGMPMVVRIFYHGQWVVETYHPDGTFFEDRRQSDWDLVNVEQEVSYEKPSHVGYWH